MPEKKVKAEKPKKVVSFKYNEDDYYTEVEDSETGEFKKALKKEYRTPLGKCQVRTAKEFGVSLEHLEKSSKLLNGKKIDGIIANDLLGRYGYYNAFQVNRADVASKYKTSVSAVDFATDKLSNIIQSSDPAKAYKKMVEEMKIEKEKEIDDEAVYG